MHSCSKAKQLLLFGEPSSIPNYQLKTPVGTRVSNRFTEQVTKNFYQFVQQSIHFAVFWNVTAVKIKLVIGIDIFKM